MPTLAEEALTAPQLDAPTGRVNFTTAEAADRIRSSTGHLANWRSAGEGPPYIKIGSRVLYPVQEFLAWEAARLVVPGR